MQLTLQDIIELQTKIAVSRHEPSYKKLFLHFHKPLLHFAYSFLKTKEPAEEVVCDVLMKVWTMKEDVLKINNLRLYLYQAVRNTCINELKKNKKSATGDIESLDLQCDPDNESPEELFIHDELRKKINESIKELPPKCRMVYKLVREDDLTYKEVADILNISTNTVDRHLNNALHKLMSAMRSYFYILLFSFFDLALIL
ncbi:MAG: polymerase sigma-70 factor [Chitinophagaceae bacterium]|nr:polymerase sigma-70 factor [Chitinophagaceae bacterium]